VSERWTQEMEAAAATLAEPRSDHVRPGGVAQLREYVRRALAEIVRLRAEVFDGRENLHRACAQREDRIAELEAEVERLNTLLNTKLNDETRMGARVVELEDNRAARARIAELEAERENQFGDLLPKLYARIAELEWALREHGEHSEPDEENGVEACPARVQQYPGILFGLCTCGLDAALAGQRETPPAAGLFHKYVVGKADGSRTDPAADYFVLRLDTDAAARHAARTYARDVEGSNPDLASDLRSRCDRYALPPLAGQRETTAEPGPECPRCGAVDAGRSSGLCVTCDGHVNRRQALRGADWRGGR